MNTPDYWQQACRELAKRDAVLKRLIKLQRGLTLRSRGDAFTTLARAIVGQQISVKAAQTVWEKLAAAVPVVSPKQIATTETTTLRTCGLSGKKIEYIQNLTNHFLEGSLNEARWPQLDDEELIAQLMQVKGIGRWTAEMFLIFYMMRPDVLPLDDIGLQRAMSLHYNKNRPVSKLKMRAIAKEWMPWRSVATWYLWRSLDPLPVEY
ncbi:MAG: DNA-3-methyladenine glycosylase family protein [Burkholderiales bacterium]